MINLYWLDIQIEKLEHEIGMEKDCQKELTQALLLSDDLGFHIREITTSEDRVKDLENQLDSLKGLREFIIYLCIKHEY
jgi:hypothetical protein